MARAVTQSMSARSMLPRAVAWLHAVGGLTVIASYVYMFFLFPFRESLRAWAHISDTLVAIDLIGAAVGITYGVAMTVTGWGLLRSLGRARRAAIILAILAILGVVAQFVIEMVLFVPGFGQGTDRLPPVAVDALKRVYLQYLVGVSLLVIAWCIAVIWTMRRASHEVSRQEHPASRPA